MQRLIHLAGSLSSPAILIVLVWCAMLLSVAVGPIDYPGQPSLVVLTVVSTGITIFLLGYHSGKLVFTRYFLRQGQMPPLTRQMLNRVVTAASLLGIVGIALVAFDRTLMSGVSNSAYSELLRCAPELVDAVSIQRTPLLYGGYAMFSFGFVSVVLFLLRGEEITGSGAALAQLSIVSPVGYAVLYSGRMPILFVLVLVVMAILVRLAQGRPPLPRGHYLVIKTVAAVALFAIYSSAIWSTRQNFCIQMSPLITELQHEKARREAPPATAGQPSQNRADEASRQKAGEIITATDLNKRFAEARAAPPPPQKPSSADAVLAIMLEAWNVKPRGYVTSAIESSRLSARGAMIGLSTYFYLTHGVRTIDITWRARDKFTPKWGVYEIGVLSPILRVFFHNSQQVEAMEAEQRAASIYGFFPTVWGAAFLDFGLVGAVIYILLWGVIAGWSAAGTRHSDLVTPSLLLVFVLASIVLSVVQGPLGMANSALVLVSMALIGFMLDFTRLRSGSPQDAGELQLNGSAT
ncbi:hypothetical protein J6524_23405 [Bradyrhizobium sp. WSM 1738]|uniref:hypothetical protein n=1 Tax=Bradyrhizobium hereditatis TaxID=2821405 RepID=UPI001CE33ABF|nr:hypothetical protein [Bradyrhizobium hereditatis]MCA6117799.1 hypothetical protein [Bradyrhizobium hereditatis]